MRNDTSTVRSDRNSSIFKSSETDHEDDSTVSYFENPSAYIIELNHQLLDQNLKRCRSFESCTTEDESTVSTIVLSFYDDFDEEDSVTNSPFEAVEDEAEALANDPYSLSSDSKKVKFGAVSIREYGVTVGSRTASSLSICPMELTWEHTTSDTVLLVEERCKQRLRRAAMRLRPLSVEERRERIAHVQGISMDDVLQLEYETSLRIIQESIASLERTRQSLIEKMDSPTEETYRYYMKSLVGESNGFFRKIMLKEIPPIPL
jgi:hypothetical protein